MSNDIGGYALQVNKHSQDLYCAMRVITALDRFLYLL